MSPSSSVASTRPYTTISSKRLSLSSTRRVSSLNPMSSVDLSAIQESLKMASLDHHRGYAQSHYTEVKQEQMTEYVPPHKAGGYQVLREAHWNKGEQCRVSFCLSPFLPLAP